MLAEVTKCTENKVTNFLQARLQIIHPHELLAYIARQ
jgi:hypothetical protein